ncbi:hypothetical protein DFH94DRAFT_846164 [Russula ochroleuca]|uniref:Uncharacterized protein n=1 Tax=Russula ochroleuca TaxID=152965 RepID=A0A9P5MSN9_9AGAM|nr:hypothetical protein DFH94DRAFT_846164 [Russula ochroleuca]
MSLRGVLAALLSSSFFFSSLAAAAVSAPCTASYAWTINSLNQSPCMVAAYMMSTCNGGSFVISPLLDSNQSYAGPSADGHDGSDLCKCNTIAYSLLSACDACQGSGWISFPNLVPPGTSVPRWAIVDVLINGTWSPSEVQSTGGPEAGPGTSIPTPMYVLSYPALGSWALEPSGSD